jgi:hypothetical protein
MCVIFAAAEVFVFQIFNSRSSTSELEIELSEVHRVWGGLMLWISEARGQGYCGEDGLKNRNPRSSQIFSVCLQLVCSHFKARSMLLSPLLQAFFLLLAFSALNNTFLPTSATFNWCWLTCSKGFTYSDASGEISWLLYSPKRLLSRR